MNTYPTAQADLLRSYVLRDDHDEGATRTDSPGDEGSDREIMGELLRSTTKLFDVHVFGRTRLAVGAGPAGVAGDGGEGHTCGRSARSSRCLIDLGGLPVELLRQLLDAFAVEIHLDRRRAVARIRVVISAALGASASTPSNLLRVDVSDGWPVVTPAAARALLRLLANVADRRGQTAGSF